MIKIDTTHPEYNENILTSDFTFDNSLLWEFTVGAGIPGNLVETSTEQHYVGEKSLKIYHTEYDTNAITIAPVTATDYDFVIPRDGHYMFSMRTLIDASAPWLPEVDGSISFYSNGSGTPTITLPFKAGNNAEPKFSYQYNKWQTLYDELGYFTKGDIVTISIYIDYQSTFTPAILKMYFDGFDVKYIDDRAYSIPSLYTLPIN